MEDTSREMVAPTRDSAASNRMASICIEKCTLTTQNSVQCLELFAFSKYLQRQLRLKTKFNMTLLAEMNKKYA